MIVVDKSSLYENILKDIRLNPLFLDNWHKLKYIKLDIAQVKQLFSVIPINDENFTGKRKKRKIKFLRKFLVAMYRNLTFKEISKQIPMFLGTPTTKINVHRAIRYMVDNKSSLVNLSHPVLGTLDQYFYENGMIQRQNITDYCTDIINTYEDFNALMCSMKVFISGIGLLENVHKDIRRYFDEYKAFTEKHERDLYSALDNFKSELAREENSYLHQFWIRTVVDRALESDFVEKLKEQEYIYKLYTDYHDEMNKKYDWKNCCRNMNVFEDYCQNIEEKGIFSESCRELLAYVYNVNIRVYVIDDTDNYSKLDDHNPASQNVCYVLRSDNRFLQLAIDEDYYNLEVEREKRDKIFEKILMEIEVLKTLQDIDDYSKNDCFILDDANLRNDLYSSRIDTYRFNEENDIFKLLVYLENARVRGDMRKYLEKLTSQFLGHNGIIHFLRRAFFRENVQISGYELQYFINLIMISRVYNRNTWFVYDWLMNTNPQKNWIVEMFLFSLENYFKKQLPEKVKWRDYLDKIENKYYIFLITIRLQNEIITIEYIDKLFHHLSNASTENIKTELLKTDLSDWMNKLENNSFSTEKYIQYHQIQSLMEGYYEENVLKLFNANKNPYLFLSIIRENIPLDISCVKICAFIFSCLLEEENIDVSEVSIKVHKEDGTDEIITTTVAEDEESLLINLHLKHNRFLVRNKRKNNVLKLNCLYNCLPVEIRLNITEEKFVNKLIKSIESSEQVRYFIRKKSNL